MRATPCKTASPPKRRAVVCTRPLSFTKKIKIMEWLLNIFRPRFKHSDESIRLNEIDNITDGKILLKIVSEDKSILVRKKALEKIDNSVILEGLILNSPIEFIQLKAYEKLRSLKIPINEVVLDKMHQIEVLVAIASRNTDAMQRRDAISKIKDNNILAELVLKEEDTWVRTFTISHIKDEKVLVELAKKIDDENVLKNILSKVNDPMLKDELAKILDLSVVIIPIAEILPAYQQLFSMTRASVGGYINYVDIIYKDGYKYRAEVINESKIRIPKRLLRKPTKSVSVPYDQG